jgi:hypothetical protein
MSLDLIHSIFGDGEHKPTVNEQKTHEQKTQKTAYGGTAFDNIAAQNAWAEMSSEEKEKYKSMGDNLFSDDIMDKYNQNDVKKPKEALQLIMNDIALQIQGMCKSGMRANDLLQIEQSFLQEVYGNSWKDRLNGKPIKAFSHAGVRRKVRKNTHCSIKDHSLKINSKTNSKWKNMIFEYTGNNFDDLVMKVEPKKDKVQTDWEQIKQNRLKSEIINKQKLEDKLKLQDNKIINNSIITQIYTPLTKSKRAHKKKR